MRQMQAKTTFVAAAAAASPSADLPRTEFLTDRDLEHKFETCVSAAAATSRPSLVFCLCLSSESYKYLYAIKSRNWAIKNQLN